MNKQSSLSCNRKLLDKINQVVSQTKLSHTSPLLPYLTQIEGITSRARRKLVKESKQVDGFVHYT